ncbi:hypothetical protein WKW80_10975 [Variovorax humicola]|uniref:Uncharacterized protein n=1 Tax=Variovorax humicola TaxID=1769758 RepID=A0ABU8VXM9_9BURK
MAQRWTLVEWREGQRRGPAGKLYVMGVSVRCAAGFVLVEKV